MSTATQNGKDSRVDAILSNRAKRNGSGDAKPDEDEGIGVKPNPSDPSADAKPDSDVKPDGRMTKAEAIRRYEESFDRSAKSIGAILDNTALSAYCAVGEQCWDTIFRAKMILDMEADERKVASSWSPTDYDDQCNKLSVRCRVFFPHLFIGSIEKNDEAEAKGKRRDPVRVSDYILAFKAVECLKTIPAVAACIDNVSYFLLINYIARKCITFSKNTLMAGVKDDWAEFCRVEIPRVATGQIRVGEFLNQLSRHENKLDEAKLAERHAGKTADQIAQAEAEANAKKKTREQATRENRVRTALSTSLADAMAGILTPDQIGAIISKTAQDAKVSLPGSLNPATVKADDILDLMKSMFMLKRFPELRAICAACADMAVMLDRFDPKSNDAERKAG
jgi:hypothetical protein